MKVKNKDFILYYAKIHQKARVKKTVFLPKVYILILNWNGWKDTIECMESLFRSSYSNYQVVVIDNGSTDGSIEKIKAWAEGKQEVLTPKSTHPLYHLSHPPVKKPIPYICYSSEEAKKDTNFQKEEEQIIESSSINIKSSLYYPLILIQNFKNLGFAGGTNLGIRYILSQDDCTYFLLLNNDTVVESDFIEKIVMTILHNPNIGILGCKIFNKINHAQIQHVTERQYPWLGYRIKKLPYSKGLIDVKYMTGCIMLINKKVFNDIGLFDEKYFVYMEDADFCYRAIQSKWKLMVNLDICIWHEGYSSSKNNRHISSYYSARNHLYFIKVKLKGIKRIVSLFIYFGEQIMHILKLIIQGENKVVLNMIKGDWDFICGRMGPK